MPKKDSRTPIEVAVIWGEKEIPKVKRSRTSKYQPVLDKLMKKPDRVAVLGEFPEKSAVSLIMSLRGAARRTGVLDSFRFAPRASSENPGLYKVYAQYLSEPKTKKVAVKERKARKPRAPREAAITSAALDAKFPKVDDQAPLGE